MPAWWAHIPEHLNPDLLRLGSFQIRYYGLMYLLAFTTVYLLVSYRVRHERLEITVDLIQTYFIWAILGVLIGGRLGYVVFYDWHYYITHPLQIVLPFEFDHGVHYTGISGMSYHGGVLALIIGTGIFCRKYKVNFWRLADLMSSAIPLGYTFGRIGNFINGELYGRVTTVPWGMYFPLDPTHQLRHPSQLYEALFEGIFLFCVLWPLRKKLPRDGALFSLYLMGYGVVRFIIEFFRQPDPQLGFVLGPFTMGQVLCALMILAGAGLLWFRWNRGTPAMADEKQRKRRKR